MKNLNATNARKDSDLLAAFHGIETVYDAAKRADVNLAVIETRGGETRLVSSAALMDIQMNFSMVSQANAGSVERYAYLKTEDAVALTGTKALEKAGMGASKKQYHSAPHFSGATAGQARTLLAKYMLPKAGG